MLVDELADAKRGGAGGSWSVLNPCLFMSEFIPDCQQEWHLDFVSALPPPPPLPFFSLVLWQQSP